jgi:hypothetical protein
LFSEDLKSVIIIELGRTLGFLNNPIRFVLPLGKTTYDFPPISVNLPPEFLRYFLALIPFFQMKFDSFFTAPVVETIPLLDAIYNLSPSSNTSSAPRLLKSREIILPSLSKKEASRLEYLVRPPA